VKRVVVDVHLLRDFLANSVNPALRRLLATHELYTTNFYYLRLCKSVVSARGGQLAGAWTQQQRIALGARLLDPTGIEITSLPSLAIRIAEVADSYGLSNLRAEAVVAAEHLRATLAVWEGDDGINIRRACKDLKVKYRTITL
jgi:hypothetical protein